LRKTSKEMRNPQMPRRLAILYPISVPWFARCVDGIRRYAQEHGEWHLICSPPTLSGAEETALTLRSMQGWRGDAIIIASSERRELSLARRMGIPVVNLAGGLAKSHGIPRVRVNDVMAGRMAANHLLDRGLRHLAYFGWSDRWYSAQRRQGFCERAAEAGIKTHSLLLTAGEGTALNWTQRIAGPAKWLTSLPRPCGVFAVHDYRAQLLLEACKEAGLRVPEDIALIGMDNEETVCEHSVPTLTSVSRNSERVGWEAMVLLERLLKGEPPPVEDLLIDPEKVFARKSTDRQYCADPLVQSAVDWVRDNWKQRVNITDIAERLGVSKRTLEMRFRESTGTSPHEFFTRLRLQRAQALLQTPQKFTVEQLAIECGFGTPATVYAAFQRYLGDSPAAFRRKHGL
jgi:LacI family transcriptional regulator